MYGGGRSSPGGEARPAPGVLVVTPDPLRALGRQRPPRHRSRPCGQGARCSPGLLARCWVARSTPVVALIARRGGAEVAHDEPPHGLNAALDHGAQLLRRDDQDVVVGVLQADLPALRSSELSAALAAAAGRRAFCADRHGCGTTLLLSTPGGELRPRFGIGSARAHRQTGAVRLSGPWPTLMCDVDYPDDLRACRRAGSGPVKGESSHPSGLSSRRSNVVALSWTRRCATKGATTPTRAASSSSWRWPCRAEVAFQRPVLQVGYEPPTGRGSPDCLPDREPLADPVQHPTVAHRPGGQHPGGAVVCI